MLDIEHMLNSCVPRALAALPGVDKGSNTSSGRAGHRPMIRGLVLYVGLGIENELESFSSPPAAYYVAHAVCGPFSMLPYML